MPDDADHLVPLAELEAARERIAGLVHRTPLLSSATAGAWTRVATGARPAGDRIHLKAEHLQKTGSFKARGMTNRILTPLARGPCARRDHAVGRERRTGLRVGRADGRRRDDRDDARRSGPDEGRCLPGLRRPGRPPRRARRRDPGRARAHPRRRRPRVRPPVRRPGGHRRPRLGRVRAASRTCPTSTWWSSGSAAAA